MTETPTVPGVVVAQVVAEDGTTPLGGACITIKGPKTYSACDDGEGDADPTSGTIEIDDVVAGDYEVTANPPADHEAVGEIATSVHVEPGQVAPLTLTYRSIATATKEASPVTELGQGVIVVQALLDDGVTPLGGVCLDLTGPAALSICDDLEGDADPTAGAIEIDGVTEGDYNLVVKAPQDYEPIDPPATVTVKPGDVTQLSLNIRKAAVTEPTTEASPTTEAAPSGVFVAQIFLEDGTTPLPGVCIQLTGPATFNVCDDGEGDADLTAGTIEIDSVPAGDYALAATPPDGYEAVDVPNSTTVADQSLAQALLTFRQTGVATPATEEATTEATTEATPVQTGVVVAQFFQEDGTTPLPGACLQLTGPETYNVCDNGDGDADQTEGALEIDGVVTGPYAVAVQAPEGYETTGETPTSLQVDADAIAPLTILFKQTAAAVGAIVVTKVDAADETALLPGACFTITGPDGNPVQACDDDGDGVTKFEGLAPGDYSVTESKGPDGYTVGPDQQTTVTAGQESPLTFADEKVVETGTLTVLTTDQNNAPVPGACYEGTGPNGATASACDDDNDGTTLLGEVAAGDWTVKQSTTPPGYDAADPAEQSVTVAAGAEASLTFINKPTVVPGSLALTTVDAEGTPLPGACYHLTGPAEAALDVCDDDGDGTTRFEGLAPGDWSIQMTTAPEGYNLAADQTVTVPAGEEVSQNVQVEAVAPTEPGTLTAISVDQDNNPVSGACYLATGPDESSFTGCDDDGDGKADLGQVGAGDWTVTQISPPPGHDPAGQNSQTVTVESGQPAEVQFTNRQTDPGNLRLPPPLPQPSSVVVIGDFQDELGCPKDNDPTCTATALKNDRGTWSGNVPMSPGTHAYRIVATSDSQRSLGAGADPSGADLSVTVPDGTAGVYVSYDSLTGEIVAFPRRVRAQVSTPNGTLDLRPIEHGRFEAYFDAPAGTLTYQILVNGETVGGDQQLELQSDSRIHLLVNSDGSVATIEPIQTASLVVTKVGADGSTAVGSCFAVISNQGALAGQACDADDGADDGVTTIPFPNGIRPGSYLLRETFTPEGGTAAPDQNVDLQPGEKQIQVTA